MRPNYAPERNLIGILGLLAVSTWALAAQGHLSATFKRGTDLLTPYLVLTDKVSADPKTKNARAQIEEGIRLLGEVTQAQPDNWAAFWFIGKGHQALRNHAAAEGAFRRAYEIKPGHTDIARELVIESVCSGKLDQGVAVAKQVVDHNPRDAGMAANLGLAYLASGQLKLARQAIERALALDPSDTISQALYKEIAAVEAGRAPGKYCPQ